MGWGCGEMVMRTYLFLRTFPFGGLRKENNIFRSQAQRDQLLVELAGIKLEFTSNVDVVVQGSLMS